ncbi:hypothetical protein EZ456_04740 [Pedobacter psychrodurus]|uniref:Uncharacterized protein n=1 Tax=Pedobacter psychrodurus TaxID=2530456 RepID=A0A4R0Q9U5_9SPHI|nr:hypothetical protein [Pedobacter psychrodurus]TCD28694.1 hypothetical protein EZ456_04740 [Pedobacter psychrodurus]
MNKKKEQVKSLEKSFGLITKTFKKQAGGKRRKDAYGFITRRLTEINQYLKGNGATIISMDSVQDEHSEPIVANIQPSQTLFEKSSSENQDKQD